eukprot:Selendium_serpulae@DN2682_c0_g1_i2.p1
MISQLFRRIPLAGVTAVTRRPLGPITYDFVYRKSHHFSTLSDYCFHPLVSKEAPDFTAETVFGNGEISPLNLATYRDSQYVCLFFYPLDFTFVCPSEIVAFDKRLKEFHERGCEVIGISVDSQFSHFAWRQTPPAQGGIGNIGYPLVSDLDKSISRSYGVLLNDKVSLRGLFLIDKKGIIRHQIVNDLPLGRSVDEALRMIDALQHHEKYGEVCPADWKKGKDAMKPTREGVANYLGK